MTWESLDDQYQSGAVRKRQATGRRRQLSVYIDKDVRSALTRLAGRGYPFVNPSHVVEYAVRRVLDEFNEPIAGPAADDTAYPPNMHRPERTGKPGSTPEEGDVE